jgi:hypothetical protein
MNAEDFGITLQGNTVSCKYKGRTVTRMTISIDSNGNAKIIVRADDAFISLPMAGKEFMKPATQDEQERAAKAA